MTAVFALGLRTNHLLYLRFCDISLACDLLTKVPVRHNVSRLCLFILLYICGIFAPPAAVHASSDEALDLHARKMQLLEYLPVVPREAGDSIPHGSGNGQGGDDMEPGPLCRRTICNGGPKAGRERSRDQSRLRTHVQRRATL